LESGPKIWFVGDSEADIACANNANLLPVLIGTPAQATKLGVSTHVADCRQLLKLLKDSHLTAE